MWIEITYPFPNFYITTVEVWEWMSNFIPQFVIDIITDPCWDQRYSMLITDARGLNIFFVSASMASENSLFTPDDDVIKWKYFPRYWPFVRGIQRYAADSPHKGQWRGLWYFLWSAPEQTVCQFYWWRIVTDSHTLVHNIYLWILKWCSAVILFETFRNLSQW